MEDFASKKFAEAVYENVMEFLPDCVWDYLDRGDGAILNTYYPETDIDPVDIDDRDCAESVSIEEFLRDPATKDLFIKWTQARAHHRRRWYAAAKVKIASEE